MKNLIVVISIIILGTVFSFVLSIFNLPGLPIYALCSILCAGTALALFSKINLKKESESASCDLNTDRESSYQMAINLANMSRDIYLKTNQLYDSSQVVNKTSKAIVSSVTEDSESILTMEENVKGISEEIDEINAGAEKTEKISESNVQAVNISEEKIQTVQRNMVDLATTNKDFSNIVMKLVDTSKAIYEIVGYMDRISDETNMLSLNASIEAARAGEAGKGFMVITKEINKLSAQSREFSSNIKGFVKEIESNTGSIEFMLLVSEEKINSTKEAIDNVQSSLNTIVGKSDLLHNNIGNVLQTSNNIKKLSDYTLEKAKALKESHNNTVALMKDEEKAVDEQWKIVEDYKKITERINELSDDSLKQSIDAQSETKLIDIGKVIMNYAGGKSTDELQKLARDLGVEGIYYANGDGIFEYGTFFDALGLNIFELDKRFVEFVKSNEDVKPYPISRRFDTGELYKFMAVKRIDASGVISVGIPIEDLIKL